VIGISASPLVVVLDRVRGDTEPDICVQGMVTCRCGAWCWLGSSSGEAVGSGRYQPMCDVCYRKHIPPGMPPIGVLHDHARHD